MTYLELGFRCAQDQIIIIQLTRAIKFNVNLNIPMTNGLVGSTMVLPQGGIDARLNFHILQATYLGSHRFEGNRYGESH